MGACSSPPRLRRRRKSRHLRRPRCITRTGRRASERGSRSSTEGWPPSSSPRSSGSWSSHASRARRRSPSGRPGSPTTSGTANRTKEIADYVSGRYKLNASGDQLLAIVAERPRDHAQHEGLRRLDDRDPHVGVEPELQPDHHTKGNVQMQLCGLGSECAITRGTATAARERLTRREALELALYTFKYVPSVNALIAYMPPPPGQTPQTLLYLERANLKDQLDQPLSKTLPLAKPPLPSQSDSEGVDRDRPADAAGRVRVRLPAAPERHRRAHPDADVLLTRRSAEADGGRARAGVPPRPRGRAAAPA